MLVNIFSMKIYFPICFVWFFRCRSCCCLSAFVRPLPCRSKRDADTAFPKRSRPRAATDVAPPPNNSWLPSLHTSLRFLSLLSFFSPCSSLSVSLAPLFCRSSLLSPLSHPSLLSTDLYPLIPSSRLSYPLILHPLNVPVPVFSLLSPLSLSFFNPSSLPLLSLFSHFSRLHRDVETHAERENSERASERASERERDSEKERKKGDGLPKVVRGRERKGWRVEDMTRDYEPRPV